MKPVAVVVDDEAEIVALIRRALTEEGYAVLSASSQEEFWAVIGNSAVDLFIFDLDLPDANGLALVKEVRRKSDVGIIILTGRAGETDHVIGLEIGADDYVTKPFRLREFRARVNTVYRRTKGARYQRDEGQASAKAATAPDYSFGPVEVYISRRRVVTKDGDEISLTTLEFDLLVTFLARPGQVLSRDQIMDALRGHNWAGYDRSVDNLVSRLRRKLTFAKATGDVIRTVYGSGYSFVGGDAA